MKTISVRGCSLAYWRAGEGEAVLFIQGTGVHGAAWKSQVDALVDFESIWFDNRGMGNSQPRGDAPITIEQMAEDVLAILDDAEVDRAGTYVGCNARWSREKVAAAGRRTSGGD